MIFCFNIYMEYIETIVYFDTVLHINWSILTIFTVAKQSYNSKFYIFSKLLFRKHMNCLVFILPNRFLYLLSIMGI